MWASIFNIVLFELQEFSLVYVVALCMNPSFALIAADEVIGAVLLVGLVANGAEVTLLVALIALCTKPLFAAHRILALSIPFRVAVLSYRF